MIDFIAHFLVNVLFALAAFVEPNRPHSVTVMFGVDNNAESRFCVHHDLCVRIDDHLGCTPAEPCASSLTELYRINADGTCTPGALPCPEKK